MGIESFLKQSEGGWVSMRSGHSLAFKQFEEIVSNIKIQLLKNDSKKVQLFIANSSFKNKNNFHPFEINWEGSSSWKVEEEEDSLNGSSLLIAIPDNAEKGIILRSIGYIEKIEATSEYYFLSDGTIVLSTIYQTTIAEERIWFVNKNVRCRSSVIKSIDNKSILQTSFASEIRRIYC